MRHWKEFKENPMDRKTIQLAANEAAALDVLLKRESVDTCSNGKAAVYQASRAKLGPIQIDTGPALRELNLAAAARALAGGIGVAFHSLGAGTAPSPFPPFRCGSHANARQGDYVALAREILAAALAHPSGHGQTSNAITKILVPHAVRRPQG
jgi:hypothetical protein